MSQRRSGGSPPSLPRQNPLPSSLRIIDCSPSIVPLRYHDGDTVTVTGLASGETLLGSITARLPATLYGLGSTGRIYSINADTGVCDIAVVRGRPRLYRLTGTSFGCRFQSRPPIAFALSATPAEPPRQPE